MAKSLEQLRKVTLTQVVRDFKEDVIGDIKVLQGIVRTDAFVNLDIPNNANAREFDGTSRNVKDMITTLRTKPHEFLLKNNGIRIIASQVIRNGRGKYTLYLDDEEGVVNGNHTANVLRRHGVERAFVPVFIQIGNLSKEQLSEVSTSLNSHKKLDERSRQDKLDKFEWVKKAIGDFYPIQYHSGGAGEISIDDVLRRAYIFYPNDKGQFLESAGTYRRVAKVPFHRANNLGKLERTSYVLKDIMELFYFIEKDPKFLRMLNKTHTAKFITPDKTVQYGLVLHTLSLAKAYMKVASTKYAVWHDGIDIEEVKKGLQAHYKDIIDILKVKKYQSIPHSDVLGDISLFKDVENLRKSIQIEYLTGQGS